MTDTDQADATRVLYTGTRPPEVDRSDVTVDHVPMLEAKPLDIRPDQVTALLDGPVAVVIYSRNAVAALDELGLGSELADRDEIEWWAVGPKTADAVEEVVGTRPEIPERHDFEGIKAELARTDLPERVVALSLAGNRRDLSSVLRSRGVAFTDRPVYETRPVDHPDLAARLREAPPDWVFLTSPRGVAIFMAQAGGTVPERTRLAAIGPSTAQALSGRGVQVDAVPDDPSVEGMFDAAVGGED
ncbi:MAG: uroporphyrinogen-III synthase [Bradymonadaceae bacterium]